MKSAFACKANGLGCAGYIGWGIMNTDIVLTVALAAQHIWKSTVITISSFSKVVIGNLLFFNNEIPYKNFTG